MTPRDFCYWLQGFFEINNPIMIDPNEMDVIKDHLKLVFKKETPDRSEKHFLGLKRDTFDDKYIQEALGIDLSIERERMQNESLPDFSHLLQYQGVPISC